MKYDNYTTKLFDFYSILLTDARFSDGILHLSIFLENHITLSFFSILWYFSKVTSVFMLLIDFPFCFVHYYIKLLVICILYTLLKAFYRPDKLFNL